MVWKLLSHNGNAPHKGLEVAIAQWQRTTMALEVAIAEWQCTPCKHNFWWLQKDGRKLGRFGNCCPNFRRLHKELRKLAIVGAKVTSFTVF